MSVFNRSGAGLIMHILVNILSAESERAAHLTFARLGYARLGRGAICVGGVEIDGNIDFEQIQAMYIPREGIIVRLQAIRDEGKEIPEDLKILEMVDTYDPATEYVGFSVCEIHWGSRGELQLACNILSCGPSRLIQ